MEKVKIETLKGLTKLPGSVEVKEYSPIKEKYVVVDRISKSILEMDEYGMMKENTLIKHIMRDLMIIILNTNIELSDDVYSDYDILHENGLMQLIEEHISSDELSSTRWLLDDVLFDAIENNNSINHIVARTASDITAFTNRTLKHVDGMLDKGDPNKIAKYLSKGIELMASKLPDLSKLDVFEAINKGKNSPKGMN